MQKTSLDKAKIKILLLEGVHPSAVDYLAQAGYKSVESLKTSLPEDELIEKIRRVHMVGIRSRTQLNAEVIAHAEKLMAIGCFCIGTNQVDSIAALRAGVPIFNAPFSNTRSVAELVLAEIILLLRGVPEKNAKAHSGVWAKSATDSHEVRGKTLGIIGYGNIGKQLGILAEGLGMHIVFYDIETKLPIGNAKQASSLDELLAGSDVVTLHVPETPATKLMVAEEQLRKMKPGSLLINASRGTVVDIDALGEALAERHLAGAAVDVFPVEPRSTEQEFISPLRKFDNVLLTPHVGGSTLEAQENIGREVSEKLIKYSDNGSTLSSVNFPEVSLPSHENKTRLLHIHKNVPGMLTQINEVFSGKEINISAQYLQTNAEIGYVVMDLDGDDGSAALKALQGIEGTIKARLLL